MSTAPATVAAPTAEHLALMALSPLDGRYAKRMRDLRPIFSEFGLMRARVQVEVAWLCTLSQHTLWQLPAIPAADWQWLRERTLGFNADDALAVKAIEASTNHDVKAIEYWLRDLLKSRAAFVPWLELIHFACTSEDINNTSHALQIKTGREQVLLPQLHDLLGRLQRMADAYAALPMLSRTHGQTASPTTVGKEMANFVLRLRTAQTVLANTPIKAKMNGAVGNYNAHIVACPELDWEALACHTVTALGLQFQAYSTQIEQHDALAALLDSVARINSILLDLARDIWGYIALGYFSQRLAANEVGSSTMPHKVNPIDFENAEGNLGLANAMLRHLSDKLPVSRWQRDLSDSTVLRNLGVALGHSSLAWHSLIQGLDKLQVRPERLAADLDSAWEVLAEAIQTVMRRYGLPLAYEQLKEKTRGRAIDAATLHAFIVELALPPKAKEALLTLTPSAYTGLAAALARRAALGD